MQEIINMRGQLFLSLCDRTGAIVHRQQPRNRIVTSGRKLVAELFGGVSGTPPTQVTQMGIGTGNTPPNDDQTSLQAPREPLKPISDVTYEDFVEAEGTANATKRVRVRLTTEFDFGEANGTEPLTEAAIFTDADIMYNRVVFEPVTKTEAFKLTLIWEIVF